ncbi:MAG: hypothetical protein K0R66_106 [Gammaproteobacteria bacterium]|jgi:hypothetical protein|nr:hypothetical protein [Gammaproteobacteria bacterium]
MFRAMLGYSISDLYKFVSHGDIEHTKACLDYFRQKDNLEKMLHPKKPYISRVVPEGAWNSIPVISAFDEKHNPHYLTAALLLDAGTNPYFCDWYGGNIFHFAINRSDIGLFILLLWYADYEKVLQLKGSPKASTVEARLEEWEVIQPGVNTIIKETAEDARKLKTLINQARLIDLDVAMPLYVQASGIYIKHSDCGIHPDLKRYYIQKALEIFQEIDNRYHKLISPGLEQKRQHVQISSKISKLAELLGLKEQVLTYKAYAGELMLEIEKESQAVQGAFHLAQSSPNTKELGLQYP